MSLKITPCSLQHQKQFFTVKQGRKDGQILEIHCPSQKDTCPIVHVRFTNVAFNKSGQVLIAATSKGDLYNFHFTQSRFWYVTNTDSCTFLKFNLRQDEEIFIGKNNGTINIVNVESGKVINNLRGHRRPVKDLSFANSDHLCISASINEAIIWDLNCFIKVQTLAISNETILKHVLFMPVSDDVITCFNDDSIHVWKYGTFERIKQIESTVWNKCIIKCLAFTRNGRILVIAGYSRNIIVFKTDTWNLEKTIILPNQITAVKKLDFISHPFDGGSNRILSILTSNGIIYFYDMLKDVILSQLLYNIEITRYDSCYDGRFIACVTSDGRVYVYLLENYVSVEDRRRKVVKVGARKHVNLKKSLCALTRAKEKIDNILETKKLISILKEYGEYPEMHRFKIWTQLLQLPHNIQQYQLLNNKTTKVELEDLERKYPMENRVLMKNLKKLLITLNLWCPFFSEVTYMPLFVFPFVKVFQNNPLTCFEAVITILINWCQFWFEYYPLPPVNVLAMIENVLLQHDPILMEHLVSCEVTSKIYAWTLMETCFSEVLSSSEWLILWDHILSNEPSFFLMAIVAYNLIQKQYLLELNEVDDFKMIYTKAVDLKKMIAKSYQLLENTEDVYHPRRYLDDFKSLNKNIYPDFKAYPKAVFDYQADVKVNEKEVLEKSFENELDPKIIEDIRLKEIGDIYANKFERRKKSSLSNYEINLNPNLTNSKSYSYYRKILKIDCVVKAFCSEYYEINLDKCEDAIDRKVNEAITSAQTLANGEHYFAQLTVKTGLKLLEDIMTRFNEKIKQCLCEDKHVDENFIKFMMAQIERTEHYVEVILNELSCDDYGLDSFREDLKEKRDRRLNYSTGTV